MYLLQSTAGTADSSDRIGTADWTVRTAGSATAPGWRTAAVVHSVVAGTVGVRTATGTLAGVARMRSKTLMWRTAAGVAVRSQTSCKHHTPRGPCSYGPAAVQRETLAADGSAAAAELVAGQVASGEPAAGWVATGLVASWRAATGRLALEAVATARGRTLSAARPSHSSSRSPASSHT